MELPAASNRTVTLLRKLGQKKYRQKKNLFVIEGERAIRQMIDNGNIAIRKLLFDRRSESWKRKEWSSVAGSYTSGALDHDTFLEVTDTENPQGILAICRIPGENGLGTLSSAGGLIVAMDNIRDPGNIGTMIRSSVWFGAAGILAGKGTVDLFHPKVVRSTAGSTGVLPYKNSDLESDLQKLEHKGWTTLVLDAAEDAGDIGAIHSPEKKILLVGNEAHGVNPDLILPGRKRIRIPSYADSRGVESLNASIAMSVALYSITGRESVI